MNTGGTILIPTITAKQKANQRKIAGKCSFFLILVAALPDAAKAFRIGRCSVG